MTKTNNYNVEISKSRILRDLSRPVLLLKVPHLGRVVPSWVKVAEYSNGSLWVYVICQIMTREGLQLKSWNLASEKYTDERFLLAGKSWHFRRFYGNMDDWIQP